MNKQQLSKPSCHLYALSRAGHLHRGPATATKPSALPGTLRLEA